MLGAASSDAYPTPVWFYIFKAPNGVRFQLPIFITHRAFQLLTGRFQLGTSGFQLPIFSTHRAVLSAWGACHGMDLQVHYGNSTLLGFS